MNTDAVLMALCGRLAGAIRARSPASRAIAASALNAAGEVGDEPARALVLLDQLGAHLEARVLTAAEEPPRACHRCGCTDANPCEGGCSWVSATLCSTCLPAELAELQATADELRRLESDAHDRIREAIGCGDPDCGCVLRPDVDHVERLGAPL